MPLFGQYRLAGADVWVWKITETVDELLAMVPDGCVSSVLSEFASKKRCAEWLAVRVLVEQCVWGGVRILYDAAGKPVLEGYCGCISISHTDGYAVVAFSGSGDVGVDAELVSRDVLSVARRFMHPGQLETVLPGDRNFVSLFHWCAKEALYKIVGDLGGNFRDNISVPSFELQDKGRVAVNLVGMEYGGERDFVADYFVADDLLIVLCRRLSDTFV